jgi:hypothetical protein
LYVVVFQLRIPWFEQSGQHQPADAFDGCASATHAATPASAINNAIRVMRTRMRHV